MVSGLTNRRAKGIAAGSRGLGFLLAALLLAPLAAAAQIPAAVNKGKAWTIVKDAWSPADEKGYEAFVQAIGRSHCSTLESCLDSDANPYRHTDAEFYRGDCADMAYILRAYYAWKNGLPFSYQHVMRTADGAREDLRYSNAGNVVVARRSVAAEQPIDAPRFIGRIGGEVSTAMFRTHPEREGGVFDDFYPVEITRRGVRPGVIAYDIYGHVGIVYDILEDGRALVVASHPDQSVTRTVYGPNFLRAHPGLGAGLKAWRPILLEGARRHADGSLRGGRIVAAKNAEIADFSVEQYFGNEPHPQGDWRYGEFRHNGQMLSYYDFVRRRLAAPGFRYNPVEELRHGLDTLCASILDRKAATDRAFDAKMHLRPHPGRLPPNIYGTFGLWEDYSTPSRDARLKVAFIELRRNAQNLYDRTKAGDPGVRYEGADLEGDLWRAYVAAKDECEFTYFRSDETRMRLNLAHVMERLWDLSFDPYHCPERRWGASGAEAETCRDDDLKTRWYKAQRYLRYQAERTYDVRMDFTVDEIKPPYVAPPEKGGLGVDAPADADIRAFLARINRLTVAEIDDPALLVPVSAPAD
jgi:hypothetical protein